MLRSLVTSILMFLSVITVSRSFVTGGLKAFPSTKVLKQSRTFCIPTVASVGASAPLPVKPSGDSIEALEIRVGKILEIGKHPEADSLYVEKVDLGEPAGPRTIVSGLVEFCSAEYLLNRDVVVLCNLKPRVFKGINSQGMLLCSSNKADGKVEPLIPPADVPLGELVSFEGHVIKPEEPGNRATKAYSKISGDFVVSDDGVATYKGIPFMTSKGPITSTLLKGPIS